MTRTARPSPPDAHAFPRLAAVVCLALAGCGADDRAQTDLAFPTAAGDRDAAPIGAGGAIGSSGDTPWPVVVNEVVRGEAADAVELMNLGATDVDLAGCRIGDDPTAPEGRFTLPAHTVVPAGGYLVLTLGGDTTGFGVGADEAFSLRAPDGAAIDGTDWADGDAPVGASWGRSPNGTGDFQTLATPTLGAANAEPAAQRPDGGAGGASPPVADAGGDGDASRPDAAALELPSVRINEVVYDGAAADWVELYNPTEAAIPLAGLFLTDEPAAHPAAWPLPPDAALPARGFLRFEVGGALTGFGLGDDEAVAVTDAAGRVIDLADWVVGAATAGASWGRLPDGEGDFRRLEHPTPGAPNVDAPPATCGDARCEAGESQDDCPFDCAPETGLVINEVVAAGEPTDAVELYNGDRTEAHLDGWFITDDPEGAPEKFELPAGTLVPPRGFLVLTIDDRDVGFRLAAAESFGLFAPDGTRVDETSWAEGDSPAEGAWARLPNGVGAFRTVDAPSLGAANAD